MKIGIGITTQNRYEVFSKSLKNIKGFAPVDAKTIVVDDASSLPVPEADYRFDKCVGIASAKNKCFELLDDCDHIFLFDDDTYPVKENWWIPYVENVEPHLMYIFQDFATGRKLNDTLLLYKDSSTIAWSHPRGCMLYYKKKCLETVGGMDPGYGRWGWEHADLSDRIFNAGLTSFKYMDIYSEGLFHSADEHEEVCSTVSGQERLFQIAKNRLIYDSKKGSQSYVSYKSIPVQGENLLITTFFTSVKDPQRNIFWEADHSKLETLIQSLRGQKLVILHDCFDRNDTDSIKYIKVESSINPYFQKWLSIYQFLIRQEGLGHVFCIDATDVELLRNPFQVNLGHSIYTADEPNILGCLWMRRHHPVPYIQQFISKNHGKPLLNTGILGGSYGQVTNFIRQLISLYFENIEAQATKRTVSVGNFDMGLFNYVAYNFFSDRLVHGQQVNTKFKAFEYNDVSWFRHK